MRARAEPPILEIEPIPENLFRDPLGYLHADHDRQRVVLNVLDNFVEGLLPGVPVSEAWQVNLRRVLNYLQTCYPLHLQDEAEDLFPALRRHARQMEESARLARRLMREHHGGALLLDEVMSDLRSAAEGGLGGDVIDILRTTLRFIETQRCSLSLVDDVLLPLARKLLSGDELDAIGRRMAARRGATFPEAR
jgi:hemerythrin-like domain-containing protein